MTANLARRANERIRQLEAEKIAQSNPGYMHTILDAPGNTMDDFVRWWGNRSMLGQALYVCLVVAVCCGFAWLIVGLK